MGCVVCCAGCYLSVLCAGCTGVTKPFTWDVLCLVQVVTCCCVGCTGVTKPLAWDVLCVMQVVIYGCAVEFDREPVVRCAGCYLSVVVQVVIYLSLCRLLSVCRCAGCYLFVVVQVVIYLSLCRLLSVCRCAGCYLSVVVQVVICLTLCRLYGCYEAMDRVRVVCYAGCTGVTRQWTGYVLCVVQVVRVLLGNGRGTCCVLCRLYGCYEAIDGGRVHDALLDLTGGITELIDLKDISSDKLIPIMTACDEMDTIMGGAIFVCNTSFTFSLFWK